MPVQGTSVRLCIGGLKDPQDHGGEEVESREEPEVLDDGIRRVCHDVGVDRDGRELLPWACSKEAEVKAGLGRAAGALEEPKDDVLGCELGRRGQIGSRNAHGRRSIQRIDAVDRNSARVRRVPPRVSGEDPGKADLPLGALSIRPSAESRLPITASIR
jgi:hypothetical protein